MSNLLPILLLCSSLLVTNTNADDEPMYIECPSNTNYTRGSAFEANLEALLSSLPAAAAASSGFAKNVTGAGAAVDLAYGLAQCRADLNKSDCRACLDGSAWDVAVKYPGQKSAMFIYNGCLLRYSKEGARIILRTCSIRFEVYPFYNIQAAMSLSPPDPVLGGGPINGRTTPSCQEADSLLSSLLSSTFQHRVRH